MNAEDFLNEGAAPTVDDHIAEAAQRFGISPDLIRATMGAESDGDPLAISNKGASGLMQVMPDTFQEMRRQHGLGPDRFDPRTNVLAGTAYLRQMLNRFGGDPQLALAAYNAGPGRVDQHLATGAPLPSETRAYVPRVLTRMGGQSAQRAVDPLSLLPNDAVLIGGTGADTVTNPFAGLSTDSHLEDVAGQIMRSQTPGDDYANATRDILRQRREAKGRQSAPNPMASLPSDAVILSGPDDPLASLPPDAVILSAEDFLGDAGRGFFSTFGTAAARGAGEAIRNAAAAPSFDQERPAEAKTPDSIDELLTTPISKGWTDPKWWAAQIGAGIGGSAPTVAAGIAGGAAGSAVAGPPGALVGSALGFGGGSFVQSLAPEYQRARAEGLDHDDAVDRALQQSGIAGAFGAAMGVAPGVGLFGKTAEGTIKRPISEALAQIFGVQPALGVGQRATQNAAAGRETTAEELLQDYALNAGAGAAMVGAHKGVERMAGRGAKPEEAAKSATEEPQADTETLALPAPQPQGEGFVMGDRPEVRQAQADAQRFASEMEEIQSRLSGKDPGSVPEDDRRIFDGGGAAAPLSDIDRAKLVQRWTIARDNYIAARNRLDNLTPQPPRPEGIQPPDTNPPLPPRNLPDVYRGATDDPAMAALPPDAALLDDAGRPALIGMDRPAGLLEAPRQDGRYTPEMAQRAEPTAAEPPPARPDVAETPALPEPASSAANRFMEAQSQQAADLQKLIDRRTREMGALQKQIAAELDPAERTRKTNLFRQKSRQVEDARARLEELQPQEAPRDVQEVQAPPRGRDDAVAEPPLAEIPAATPQPGDRVRVTNAKTGQAYEATLTGERGPRTLVTRDDGKKLQPLTAAHSIERVEAAAERPAPATQEATPDLGPTLPPKQSRINGAARTPADLEASIQRADETRNRPRLTPEQQAAAEAAKAETLRKFDEAAATDRAGWKSQFNSERDAAAASMEGLRAVEYRTGWDDALRGERTIEPEFPEDFGKGVRDARAWLASNPPPEGPASVDITARTSRGRETKYTLPADADAIRRVRENIDKLPIDRFRLTDEAERAAPALEADLRAQLKRYGIDDRVGFRLVDAIRDRQTGEAIPGALGRYGRRVIEVATSAPDRAMTMNHEAVHAIRELGLLTQKEWDALKQAALRDDGVKLASVRRRYKNMGLDEESMFEEAVADLFADWQAGRRDAGAVRAILERIRDFFAAVGQAFRGQGFTTPESVFRAIDEGRIGRRGAQEQPAGAVAEAFERQQRPEGQGGAKQERDSFALAPTEQALADAILADQPSLAERVKKAFGANRSGIGSEAVRQLVNQFQPIFDLEMRAEGKAGRQAKLRDARVSAAKMTELAVQDSGRLESMLVEGPLKWNASEGIVENAKGVGGLLDIFKPLKNADDYKRFQLYAIARRAQRLKAEGRENLLSDAQIKEGMKLESPEFKKVFDGYQKFNRAMLDFAVDTGVIKAASRDLYANGMDYVPFYRVAEETGELPPPATLAKLSNPDPKIRKLEGGTDKIGDLAENVIRNATALAKAGMRNEAMRRIHGVLSEIGEAKNLTAADEKAGSAAFFDKGVKRHFVAEDPAVMAAMAGLRPEQQAGIYKGLASFSNVLRRGVTASPGFMLANFIRDSASAWVQTGGTLTLANNGITGLIRAAKGADSVKELKTAAGIGGYEFGHGARDMAAEFRRRLGVEVATSPKAILDKILRPLEEVGSWTEVANRDAIYRNLLDQGASKAEAAYQALNLLNFSRKGANQSLRFMLPLVPFLNARIQGLYRLAETQGNAKALKGVILRGLLLTGVSAALTSAFGDSEALKNATLEDRLNYYLIPLPDGKIAYIPKPFEFGALFSTMPEFLFDAIRKKDGADLAKATAMTFLNTFSFNPIPQAVKPALEAWTNYDFFSGRAIESPSDQRVMPGARGNARTSDAMKALGRETNISPIQAEHMVRGYLGTLGQMTLAGADAIMRAAGTAPPKPAGVFGSTPGVSTVAESVFGRFYRDQADTANRWVGDFYDLKHQADEVWNTVRKLRQDGEADKAKELWKANFGLLALRKRMDKLAEPLQKATRKINDIRSDDEMAPEEKRTKINVLSARRNNLARKTEEILQKIKDAQAKEDARNPV